MCVSTYNALRYIKDFRVLQQSGVPSDHSPISLTVTCTGVSRGHLLEWAASLGGHPEHNNTSRSRLTSRPVRLPDIDRLMFANNVANVG